MTGQRKDVFDFLEGATMVAAAIAWNSAAKGIVEDIFPGRETAAMVAWAVIITIVGMFVIHVLDRIRSKVAVSMYNRAAKNIAASQK